MCENCFSTCESNFDKLKTVVLDLFKLLRKNGDEPTFSIYISSFRPYQNTNMRKWTRSLDKKYTPSSEIFDRAFCSHNASEKKDEKANQKIKQFINPWVFEYLLIAELTDISMAQLNKNNNLSSKKKGVENLCERYNEMYGIITEKCDYIKRQCGFDVASNNDIIKLLSDAKRNITEIKEQIKNEASNIIKELNKISPHV